MRSAWTAAAVAVLLLASASAEAADAPLPVRIRVLQGSRQGAPGVPPGLEDLRAQLSATAYVRWEQAGEVQASMAPRKPVSVALPGGESVTVTLVESRSGAARALLDGDDRLRRAGGDDGRRGAGLSARPVARATRRP
jgi:hypothetical protein